MGKGKFDHQEKDKWGSRILTFSTWKLCKSFINWKMVTHQEENMYSHVLYYWTLVSHNVIFVVTIAPFPQTSYFILLPYIFPSEPQGRGHGLDPDFTGIKISIASHSWVMYWVSEYCFPSPVAQAYCHVLLFLLPDSDFSCVSFSLYIPDMFMPHFQAFMLSIVLFYIIHLRQVPRNYASICPVLN